MATYFIISNSDGDMCVRQMSEDELLKELNPDELVIKVRSPCSDEAGSHTDCNMKGEGDDNSHCPCLPQGMI